MAVLEVERRGEFCSRLEAEGLQYPYPSEWPGRNLILELIVIMIEKQGERLVDV